MTTRQRFAIAEAMTGHTATPDSLARAMAEAASLVANDLAARLDPSALAAPAPTRLFEAMRHGVLNGGKRVRPFLVLESARLFDHPVDAMLPVASALEAIHSYSLIHDDLPAMDDDDLRRGKPTVHIANDEATAILAGDGLLTAACEWIAEATGLPDRARLALISDLARAAGPLGMVGGQSLDLIHEGDATLADADIIAIQGMKTGALIRFAARSGALCANDGEGLDALTAYGETIGLAFQVADDLLDVTQTSAVLGKTAGKDIGAEKATLVARHGTDWARDKLDELRSNAESHLVRFGDKADRLRALARFITERTN